MLFENTDSCLALMKMEQNPSARVCMYGMRPRGGHKR